MTIQGQLDIFDILEFQVQRRDVTHLAITTSGAGTFTNPGDLEAMFQKREAHYQDFNVMKGNWKPYRGWEISTRSGSGSEHDAGCYSAELRCRHYGHRDDQKCLCVSMRLYRVYCEGCEAWTGIYDSENKAWEAHLDECWPGWRNLPIVESRTVGYSYKFTFPDDYPKEFKRPGAPIRDCRGLTKYATRHVPAAEPFGGVKIAVVQDCRKHNQKGEK